MHLFDESNIFLYTQQYRDKIIIKKMLFSSDRNSLRCSPPRTISCQNTYNNKEIPLNRWDILFLLDILLDVGAIDSKIYFKLGRCSAMY